MTRTLNSEWRIEQLFEVRDGSVIATGKQQNLRELNRVALHDYAYNVATTLAVLTSQNRIAVGVSYFGVGIGRVRLPRRSPRVRLHIYGERSRVQLWIGGTLRTTATQASSSDAWASTSIVLVSGLSPDADGLVTLELLAERTAPGSTGLIHILVEEVPMTEAQVPDVASNGTAEGFLGMHDEAYATADDPVDVFQMQSLDENQRWLWRDRGRKCLHLYPRTGQFARLSSYTWRLDGPYTIEAPIHAQRLDVAVTVEVPAGTENKGVEVLALSEYEQLEQVISSRAVLVAQASGVQHLTFRDLKMRPGQPCLVWVAFRSEVYEASESTLLIYSHSTTQPHMLWCDGNSTMEATQGLPWGLCMVLKSEDLQTSRDPAIKNALGYNAPEQICDLACVNGYDTDNEALQVCISPSPATGITRVPMMAGVSQWWTVPTNSSYTPSGDVRRMAVAFLYGVFMDVGGARVTSRRKGARAGVLPSAGLLQAIRTRYSTSTVQGTPCVLLRHGGNERLRPTSTPSGKTILYRGRYLYVSGDGAESTLWPIPLADPNFGVTSGLICRKLYGQFIFMASLAYGVIRNEEEGLIEAGFVGAGVEVGPCRIRHFPAQGAQMSPTEADALIASQSTATQTDDVTIARANAWTQEFTWPSEGEFRRGIWDLSPVFSINTPSSFPAQVVAEIKPKGGARYAAYMQLVVAGLHVWWGPRS